MRHRLFLYLLVVFLAIGCQQKRANSDEPAMASYNTEDRDIGDIYVEDGTVKIKFQVTNIGGKPMYIKNVTTSCECTSATYDERFIYSGDNAEIVVTLDPSNFSDGAFERMVGVYTSAKQRPDTLYFHGVAKHKN